MSGVIGSIRAGLHAALAAAADLSEVTAWYTPVAPQAASYPYGIFQIAAGGDTNESPLDTLDEDWIVKVVDTDAARAERLADAIRDTLHNTSLTLGAGWVAYDCQHDGPLFFYNEMVGSVQHYHAGSTFRIRAHEDAS